MSKSTNDLLRELADVLDGMESPIAFGGRWTPPSTVALVLEKQPRLELFTPKRGASKKALESLMASMSPAPFGDGTKTRVDRSVRDALQLDVDKKPFEIDGFDPRTSGVLDAVRSALLPDIAGTLTAELSSVNVYGVGGHFARHKDTPRGEGMVGTLVVCLPFPFEGGELALERGNGSAAFDWAGDLAREPRALHYAAFFGDVDHEIHRIESGHRVTVSYVLHVTKAKTATRRAGAAHETSEVQHELAKRRDEVAGLFAKVAADTGLRAEGMTLRIPCEHQYAVTPKAPALEWLTSETTQKLKGRDADVARAALAAGLPVALVHCLAVVGDGEEYVSLRLAEPPTGKQVARIRSRVAARDVDALDDALRADDDRALRARTIGSWYNGVLVASGEYSATGYYGNEAADAEFYVSSVLDVTIARAGAGPGKRVRHGKFGAGIVLAQSKQGVEPAFRIRFDDGEERTVLERFVTTER